MDETTTRHQAPTQSEDVTEPGGRLVEPILAYAGGEVVTVVSVAEIRESDAVLDVDGVVVRPRDQRPGPTKDEPVVLHRAPGLDLAHRGGPRPPPGAPV